MRHLIQWYVAFVRFFARGQWGGYHADMRLTIQYPAGILVGLAMLTGGCGKGTADSARLQRQLDRVRSELSEHLSAQLKVERSLRHRVARLEAELAALKRRPVRRVEPPGRGAVPRRQPPDTGERPVPRVACPASLPDAARKVRQRMRLAKLTKLLDGITIRRSKALTLTGSGSRMRQVWTGPCFRITLQGGRVVTVELEGVKTKRRRRRRRRR